MKAKRPSHKDRVIAARLNDESYDERWKDAYIWAEAAKVRKASIERMRKSNQKETTNDGEQERNDCRATRAVRVARGVR